MILTILDHTDRSNGRIDHEYCVYPYKEGNAVLIDNFEAFPKDLEIKIGEVDYKIARNTVNAQ